MSRVPLASEGEDPLLQELVAKIHARGLDVPNLYMTIGNAPNMLQAWMGFTWPLRHDAASPRQLRELVVMRVAQWTRCAYMWAHHWSMATENGLTSSQLETLADWRKSDEFDHRQQALLGYTEEVIGGHGVQDATFRQMQQVFPTREIIELTLAATFYLNLAHFALALDIDIEPKFEAYAKLLPVTEEDTRG